MDYSAPTEPDGVTPAEPDGVFTHRAGAENEARVYEYFRRETVVASGRPVAVGGPGPGGTGAEGPGEGEFEGELGELATFLDRASRRGREFRAGYRSGPPSPPAAALSRRYRAAEMRAPRAKGLSGKKCEVCSQPLGDIAIL